MKIKYSRFFAVIFLLISVIFFSGETAAQSLWSDDSQAVYTKIPRTYKIGDLFTLIIIEQASASYESGTQGEEGGSVAVGPGQGLLTNLLPHVEGSTENSYNGEGATSRKGKLSARLTVSVVEVEPGTGNLVIEGKQKIEVNRDSQELIVRGKVRPEDIGPDNTIYSSSMADAEIKFTGEGVYDNHTKPGLLSRFFSWLL